VARAFDVARLPTLDVPRVALEQDLVPGDLGIVPVVASERCDRARGPTEGEPDQAFACLARRDGVPPFKIGAPQRFDELGMISREVVGLRRIVVQVVEFIPVDESPMSLQDARWPPKCGISTRCEG